MNDTELIGSEIEHDWSYLKPVRYVPVWQGVIEGIAFVLILSALLYGRVAPVLQAL